MSATLTGIGVGQTAVVAEVLQITGSANLPEWAHSSSGPAAESEILMSAISGVELELRSLSEQSSGETSEILEALAELLTDAELIGPTMIQLEKGWSAAAAYGIAVNEFCTVFTDEPTLQERAQDLQELSKRVQAAIAGVDLNAKWPSSGNYILVAQDFAPSDAARFGPNIVGVITVMGGPTSHTSIICRALGIPALVGARLADGLPDGSSVLLDPLGNRAIVDGRLEDATAPPTFVPVREFPRIEVRANIGSADDAVQAKLSGCNGVGLMRTELLYLSRNSIPTLKEQIVDYSEIFALAPQGPITVRTLDPERDKQVPFLPMPGVCDIRNYRVLEFHRDFLELQLEAIAEAGEKTGRELWVMAPMIGTSKEALEFAALAKKYRFAKVGVMLELTSLIEEIPLLSEEIDFISVGTNDLAQNIFGMDRMNVSMPEFLDPWHPVFLDAMTQIATLGKVADIPLSVCGEVAANPAFAIKLADLGFDSVSVAPSSVSSVTAALRS